jgi:hypothetical protein
VRVPGHRGALRRRRRAGRQLMACPGLEVAGGGRLPEIESARRAESTVSARRMQGLAGAAACPAEILPSYRHDLQGLTGPGYCAASGRSATLTVCPLPTPQFRLARPLLRFSSQLWLSARLDSNESPAVSARSRLMRTLISELSRSGLIRRVRGIPLRHNYGLSPFHHRLGLSARNRNGGTGYQVANPEW